MPIQHRHIKFRNTNRGEWINQIITEKSACDNFRGQKIIFHFDDQVRINDLEPVHLVTLACLIEHIFLTGNSASISTDNQEILDYITKDLGFKSYWSGGKNHVDATFSTNIFNLWRILDSEKDMYAKHVESYLRSTYLSNKDLSSVNVCLVEAFYNVFDHANANGNAFSLLNYNECTGELHGAICDFGMGIRKTIQKKYPEIEKDIDAIELSIKTGITAQSTHRNKGFGMGNIVDNVDTIRILSGTGLFVKREGEMIKKETQFSFPGTLLYFYVNLSSLDDEVVIDEFSL